jgi:hypothetical protein
MLVAPLLSDIHPVARFLSASIATFVCLAGIDSTK